MAALNTMIDKRRFNTEIIKLFCNMKKYNVQIRDLSCCMNSFCTLRILFLTYDNDDEKRKLDKETFENIVNIAPIPQDLKLRMLLGCDYSYTKDFISKMKKENYDYKIRQTQFQSKHKNIAFLMQYDTNSTYNLEDESNSIMHCEFLLNHTQKIYVPTMCIDKEMVLQKYICKETNSLVVFLNWGIDEKMMILMPHKPSKMQELVYICENDLNADVINNYISRSDSQVYSKIYMPKFSIKSAWILNYGYNSNNTLINHSSNYYLQIPVNESNNFSNVYTSNNDYVGDQVLYSISNVQNCKTLDVPFFFGSFYERIKETFFGGEENILRIDKSFIFTILNKNNIISDIGIYVG